jgi:hypothetical protein
VEGVCDIFTVRINNFRVGYNGNPVVLATLWCFDAVHAETTRQTRYTAKDAFKCLTQMMTDIIFKYLKINSGINNEMDNEINSGMDSEINSGMDSEI